MAESQIEKPLENEVDLTESTIEFLGSLHPFFSRALIYLLLLFIALTLAWAWYGQVDIVATAPFRLVPLGKVQNIQAPRSGEIQKIAIASGDRIVEEQILFRLHSRETLQEFRELEQAEIAFKQAEFDLQQTLQKKRVLAKETISALEHRVRVMQTVMQTYNEALGNHVETRDTTSHTPDLEMEIQFRSAEVEHLKQRYEQNQKLYEKRLISLATRNEAKVRYLGALAELPARMAEINRYEVSLKELRRQILEEQLEIERTAANFQNAYDIASVRLKRAKQTVNRSVEGIIDLEKTTLQVHGEEKAFMFGMKGTAEIITDRQSILMLALKPLRQLRELTAFSPKAE